MLKRIFRRYIPATAEVRAKRWVALFGGALQHPNLWHFNRDSVAGAVAIGLFAGLVPGPLQMLCALALAIPLRRNVPVALLTTLYTNPFTIVPLYLVAYAYGNRLLGAAGARAVPEPSSMSWSDWLGSAQALIDWSMALGKPLAVGLVALALSLAAVGYVVVQVAWRITVVLAWRARKRRRARTDS